MKSTYFLWKILGVSFSLWFTKKKKSKLFPNQRKFCVWTGDTSSAIAFFVLSCYVHIPLSGPCFLLRMHLQWHTTAMSVHTALLFLSKSVAHLSSWEKQSHQDLKCLYLNTSFFIKISFCVWSEDKFKTHFPLAVSERIIYWCHEFVHMQHPSS